MHEIEPPHETRPHDRRLVWIAASAVVAILGVTLVAAFPRAAETSVAESSAQSAVRPPASSAATSSAETTAFRPGAVPPPATSRGEKYRYKGGDRTFAHTASIRTGEAYSGVALTMTTTGLELTGGHDFHEMSLTMYAPGPYSNGEAMMNVDGTVVPMPATLALAVGRSSGYDSFPGETIHDRKLYAYVLSTYCAAEAERNHQFLYWGGVEKPVELKPGETYDLRVEYTGESRWIPHADAEHPPSPGRYADWADKRGHRAYRWVARIDGSVVADCWFNAPVGYIKYECNKVEPEVIHGVNRFYDVRVRTGSGPYRDIPPATTIAARSGFGSYTIGMPSAGDVTFSLSGR